MPTCAAPGAAPWASPQFLPSEFYKYAVDFDGDGKKDIWNSVPDALASAAQQLVGKGWQRGVRWAYEVRAPQGIDCTLGVPEVTRPLGEWLKQGFVPAYGRKPSAADCGEPASLLLPEGTYGPAFLTLKNYYVIKEYNFSDLYVLFVGHLSDRIGDPRAVRDAVEQGHAAADSAGREHAAHADQARALQGQDRRQGRHADARGAGRLSEGEPPEGRLLADRGRARPHAKEGCKIGLLHVAVRLG